MQKLKNLKIAMLEKEIKQRDLAKMVGVPETVFSNAMAGRWVIKDEQKQKVALILNKDISELFSE